MSSLLALARLALRWDASLLRMVRRIRYDANADADADDLTRYTRSYGESSLEHGYDTTSALDKVSLPVPSEFRPLVSAGTDSAAFKQYGHIGVLPRHWRRGGSHADRAPRDGHRSLVSLQQYGDQW